jgi:hypothetical protein
MTVTLKDIPYDIVLNILQYDNRVAIRGNRFKFIGKLSKDDWRYQEVDFVLREIFLNPQPSSYGVFYILPINKHKDYCISVDEYVFDEDEYYTRREIVRNISFVRSFCADEFLLSY